LRVECEAEREERELVASVAHAQRVETVPDTPHFLHSPTAVWHLCDLVLRGERAEGHRHRHERVCGQRRHGIHQIVRVNPRSWTGEQFRQASPGIRQRFWYGYRGHGNRFLL